jgi:hypothetical protein
MQLDLYSNIQYLKESYGCHDVFVILMVIGMRCVMTRLLSKHICSDTYCPIESIFYNFDTPLNNI